MIATTIELKGTARAHFTAMVRHFWCHKNGWWDTGTTQLDDLFEYRRWLNEAGLDCNEFNNYRRLQEAFYPIDLTQPHLDAIMEDSFDLDSLVVEPKAWDSLGDQAVLAILSENSD